MLNNDELGCASLWDSSLHLKILTILLLDPHLKILTVFGWLVGCGASCCIVLCEFIGPNAEINTSVQMFQLSPDRTEERSDRFSVLSVQYSLNFESHAMRDALPPLLVPGAAHRV